MKSFAVVTSLVLLATSSALAAPSSSASFPLSLVGLRTASSIIEHGMANVHLDWQVDEAAALAEKAFKVTYGSCHLWEEDEEHALVASMSSSARHVLPKRAVWFIEEHSRPQGCLWAWMGDERVGRSEPLTIVQNERQVKRQAREEDLAKRDSSSDNAKIEDFDTTGLWFEGVEHAKAKHHSSGFVSGKKDAHIAIVGAGISGLMTSHLLESVGMTNYTLIEAAERFGGRVHTEYFDEDKNKHVYQEMGPMRFPKTMTDPETNKTLPIRDSYIVFQLAEELNKINAGNDNRTVEFIDWIQSAPGNLQYTGGVKLANGLPPNNAQLEANATLAAILSGGTSPESTAADEAIGNITATDSLRKKVVTNIFKAHHDWIKAGLDDFSEFGYLHNKLGYDLDTTDKITSGYLGAATSFWDTYYEDTWFASTTTSWKTIDRGLTQLPMAFWGTPAANKTIMGRKIFKVDNDKLTGKVQLYWKPNNTASTRDAHSATYDYAVISAPFSVVKYWRTPNVSERMQRAIKNLKYSNSCKVAMQFSSRFWEHAPFDPPIQGGCSNTDLPGIRNVCYPPYKIGSEGPAVVLAEYVSGDDGDRLVSWPEDYHIQYVLDAMAEMHGSVVYDEYVTARRRCWGLDEFQAAAWASPIAGQHKLYIPEYYKTHNNTIFIGEHTSFTHAWISSALESAVRGTAQLLLELGLVDEAQQITKKWMGRWMNV